MQVSAFTSIFKADFGRFRLVPAVFRLVSAVSAAGRYDPRWPIRANFGRISPIWRKSKPIGHESSRIGANQAESARIREKKKKKNADAVRRVGNRVGRGCGTSGASMLSSQNQILQQSLTWPPSTATLLLHEYHQQATNGLILHDAKC